jgi:hypothetical protein
MTVIFRARLPLLLSQSHTRRKIGGSRPYEECVQLLSIDGSLSFEADAVLNHEPKTDSGRDELSRLRKEEARLKLRNTKFKNVTHLKLPSTTR